MKNNEQNKNNRNRVVACFAAILLLLPGTAVAQHFDAPSAAGKLPCRNVSIWLPDRTFEMQAGKKW